MKQKLKVPKSASMYCPEKGGYVRVGNCIKCTKSVIGFLLLKLKKMVSRRHRRTKMVKIHERKFVSADPEKA